MSINMMTIKKKNDSNNIKKYDKYTSPINIINNNNSINNNNKHDKNNNDYIKINTEQNKYNNTKRNDYRNMDKEKNNFIKTDINFFNNYNLQPNSKLKKEREIFKRLLYKLKKSNELYYKDSNNNKRIENFILNVLNSNYFLRKLLYVIYECSEIYNPNNKRTITETIHDSEFISKLNSINNSDEENDIENINNIKLFEKGLEEIKKIAKETKNLQDKISQFVYKINATNE